MIIPQLLVSIECRKTKTKVITLANEKLKDGENSVNQSKLEVITRSRHKARERCTRQPRLVLVSRLLG